MPLTYFLVLLLGSTCFEHNYAHHQELTTVMLITTLVVSFCKVGRGSVNVKLWFLVVSVRCEVVCRLVVAGNVFLLNFNGYDPLCVVIAVFCVCGELFLR